MHATVFEWNKEAGVISTEDCAIVIEAGRHFLHYVVTGAENEVLAVKFLRTEQVQGQNWPQAVEEIIQIETLLNKTYRQATVVYSLAEQILIPEKYFDVNINRSMLDMVHGDLHKGVTLSEKVHGWDVYNVYRVPSSLHNCLQQQFAGIQSWHHHTLSLQYFDKMDSSRSDKLLVSFYYQTMMITLIKNKALQLVQPVDYQTAEDVAYYLLQVCSTHSLSPSSIPVLLDGMIEVDSAMYREIYKYFADIQLLSTPSGIQLPEMPSEYPPHFFSPLLKMMLCVL